MSAALIPHGTVLDLAKAVGHSEALAERLTRRLAAHEWDDLTEGREVADLLTDLAHYLATAELYLMAVAELFPAAPHPLQA